MTRIVCVGDVMIDIVAHLPGPLAHGSDTPAPVTLHGGGSAANTAAWLAVAGVPVTLVGRVGADPAGANALDVLRRCGVDLDVTVDPDLPTGTCIVLVDPAGERTMIPSAGANTRGGTVPALAAADHLHVSGYAILGADPALAAVTAGLAAARAAGCGVSVDAASAAPLRAFGPRRFLDLVAPALLFANRDEAAVLSGTRDPSAAALALGLLCGATVVKDGPHGATWSDGHRVEHVPTPAAAVVDTVGAGDAFAAGVLAARSGGADPVAAVRAGHELAARAVGLRGGRPRPA